MCGILAQREIQFASRGATERLRGEQQQGRTVRRAESSSGWSLSSSRFPTRATVSSAPRRVYMYESEKSLQTHALREAGGVSEQPRLCTPFQAG